MEHRPLDGIVNIFYCQIIAAILALALVMILDYHVGTSFLAGEVTMLLANGFLSWRVLRQRQSMRSMNLLLSFFSGEVGKYVFIVLGTLVFARLLRLDWLFYIVGLGVPQLGGVIIYGMKKAWRT